MTNTGEQFKQLVFSLGKCLTSSLDFNDIFKTIMQEVERYYQPSNWSLFRVDEEADELYFVFAKGMKSELAETIRLKLGEGIAGTVAQTGQTIYVPDVTKDSRFSDKVDQQQDFVTQSLIAVPVKFQSRVLGVIELVNSVDNASQYDPDDLQVLEMISEFAAIAFENASLYQRAVHSAEHDTLTGLYNRTRLQAVMDAWQALPKKSARKSDHVLLVLIDLNKFKQANDQQGHHAGDQVLIKTAELLRGIGRGVDNCYRMGGDEFLLLVEDIMPNNAAKTQQRLTQRLEQASQQLPYDCSFAYGFAYGHKRDIEQLLKQADIAMYQHKSKSYLSIQPSSEAE